MPVNYFLYCAILFVTVISGQKVSQPTARDFEIERNDEKIKFVFDDLEVQIKGPPARKHILNTQQRNPRHTENINHKTGADSSKMNGIIDQLEGTTESNVDDAKKKRAIINFNETRSNGNNNRRTSTGNSSLSEKTNESLPDNCNEVKDNLNIQNDTGSRSQRDIVLKSISEVPAMLYTKYTGGDELDLSLTVNIATLRPCQETLDCETRDSIEKQRMVKETKKNSALEEFVETHMKQGYDLASNFHHRAKTLVKRGSCPLMHTPSMLNSIQSRSRTDIATINKQSELALFGTRLLQQTLSEDYNMTAAGYVDFLRNRVIRISDKNICQGNFYINCDLSAKYRTIDGSCNNIFHPFWGRTNSGLGRVLPPRYSDGIHRMPISVTGAELPNPRVLSTRLIIRGERHDPELSLVVMQWGQVVAHDLARQVPYQTAEGDIECCVNDGTSVQDKSLQHHSCAPIEISPNDLFYSQFDQRCMNFVRSMTVLNEDCTLGPARQLNAVTSFLDCSQMYGVSDSESEELREFFGGRLKVEYRRGRWWLPTSKNESDVCDIRRSDDFCYVSGDPRTNQNPQLVVLHTLLVREHNRVARTLSVLNPHWDDEKLFQETRRIVIAEYQHITYNEWLPVLFGDRVETRSHFTRTKRTMSNDYNENIDPSTIIGFTTGAYRSLHSMVVGNLGICDEDRKIVDVLKLENHFFRPAIVEKNDNFAGLLRGLIAQHAEMQDTTLSDQLTEFMFRSLKPFGMDLTSIDIQRGRDHGVPGYNAYRKFCNLHPAKNFDDLHGTMSPENVEKLRREYAHVDDIDLIIGASMEILLPGSRLGPTNVCLLREQFHRSRVGDRYFYDNANFPHSFTPEQFEEITKVTLSRLVCDTEAGVDEIQPKAFRVMSRDNPLVSCDTLPKLDLTLWEE